MKQLSERRTRTRYRPLVNCAVATLALLAVGVGPASSVGAAAPPAANATAARNVTLSMAVPYGAPVPLKVVTDGSKAQYADMGYTGQGIDVAIIDSGVTPVVGLNQPGKVIYGPDLSNEGGLPNLANLDTYGHGTHMAGIIAGNDGSEVGGIATSSRIVSLKVAGATGETNIAQVIAAIDWVIQHKTSNGLNIRVLNLSLGISGGPHYTKDPLSAAVERAWFAGIVVVAAAGNRSTLSPLDSPAVDPYVIAVGGMERYDSTGKGDMLALWSSGGDTTRQPDVVAAGRSLQSFRVPGSMLEVLNPAGVVDANYFRGSGTSQAAAVVSGYVAALLSRQPRLTPDQVKFLVTSTAIDLVPYSRIDGSGKIDPTGMALSIAKARRAPAQSFARSTAGVNISGNLTITSWSGGSWNGASWSGGTWSGASWSGASWSGASWSGGLWSGASWSGASWSGASWSGASWSGASWSGASWSGASWCGASWLGAVWS